MGTIVQDYGPIYGEAVNGTVQGRPNGSVYVPVSNVISITIADERKYIKNSSATQLRICNSAGAANPSGMSYVAVAQDLSSYVVGEIYADEELTTLLASRNVTAGNFNGYIRDFVILIENTEIVADETYYAVARLMNNGVPIAVSETIALKGVVVE